MSSSRLPLAGKTAIVTGGSRGIGRAISLTLASLGCSILIVHSDPSKSPRAQQTITDILSTNPAIRAFSICADLRDPSSPKKIVEHALQSLQTKKIDILVNNAGITNFTPTTEISMELYDDIYNTNLRGPLFLTQAVVKHMPNGGRVINISTVLAKHILPKQLGPLYASSKAAMDSLTRTWSFEWGKSRGITVNSVSVGPTMTDMASAFPGEVLAKFVEEAGVYTAAEARLGEPDDIAQVVGFLAGEGSRWITGSTIGASGGMFFD